MDSRGRPSAIRDVTCQINSRSGIENRGFDEATEKHPLTRRDKNEEMYGGIQYTE
jgi:hypothetical protein